MSFFISENGCSLSGAVATVITQGDSVFVGKVFGAAALGYYQMAFLISNVLATEITNTVFQVVFPSYSQIREDRQRLKEAFFRVFQFIVVICFPLSAGFSSSPSSLLSCFWAKNGALQCPSFRS